MSFFNFLKKITNKKPVKQVEPPAEPNKVCKTCNGFRIWREHGAVVLCGECFHKDKPFDNERYPMCKDQLAQIDCLNTDCKYNNGGGQCGNVSPAITLNYAEHAGFVCWSKK